LQRTFQAGLFLFFVFAFIFSQTSIQAKGRKKKKGKHHSVQGFRARNKPTIIALENPDSPEFQLFLKKVKEIKNGKADQIRMLILGDSHMQCEDFGIAFSSYLVDSLGLPQAGRGFVFPYSLARTSHRGNMSFGPSQGWHGCRFTKNGNACDWGLAGWTAHLDKDSADFSWKMEDQNFEMGDDFLLFAPPYCAYTHRVLMFDSTGNQEILFYNPQKNAFQGKILSPTRQLFFQIERQEKAKEFVLQGFLIKPMKRGLVTGISGTNGARLDHYLQNPDFQKHLSEIKPDLVLVSLGTNDVFSSRFNGPETQSFLKLLLARIKASAPGTAILLVGPPDHCLRKRKINPKTEKINQLYAETADELDFTFWNQQKAMGGKGSIFFWRQQKWATSDLVHFSQPGYRKQAWLLYKALKKSLDGKY
jgi:lysophospholipase L1-like esterase